MLKLTLNAIAKFLCGIISISILIFLPAGTLDYFGGKLLLLTLFAPMLICGIIMLIFSPKLLASRLDFKEKQKGQRTVIALTGLIFILGFVSAGIDFRLGISNITKSIQIVASVIFLVGYIMYFFVLSQNKYISRTIKVTHEQTVVSGGLYSVVRHPMYTSSIIMFLSIPFVLGSYISLVAFIFYPLIIARRIMLEENFLEKELNGYSDYKEKVKYRLIPFIW